MLYSQSELTQIGKKHFSENILPQLRKISAEVVDNMFVFIEGSVSYGFCDKYSDVDIDFYISIDIEEKIFNRIKEVFNAETYWYESVRVSYGFGGSYWKFDLLLNNNMEKFWNEFNPYALNNINQAIPIWDPNSLMSIIKNRIGFYPEEINKKVLRGLWITINDSGEYNTLESIKRNNTTEGRIYLFRALEAMMRIIYVLNKKYYPPTKWLSTGLEQLDADFGIKDVLNEINMNNSLSDNYYSYLKTYKSVKDFMLENNTIEKECIENYGTVFQKSFFVFNTF